MHPVKRQMYIDRSSQAGQKDQFKHSPIFLLAGLMALTDRVKALESKAGIVEDENPPVLNVDQKTAADVLAKQKAQADADAAAAAAAQKKKDDIAAAAAALDAQTHTEIADSSPI